MLSRALTFSFTLIWVSATAACIAVMSYLGFMPSTNIIDLALLFSSFAFLILNAVVVILSTLLLKRFEFKFRSWYLIPLGYMVILYGSSLYVIKAFLANTMLLNIFMWVSMVLGVFMISFGMYFFARDIKSKESIRIKLAQRKIFIATCIVIAVLVVYTVSWILTSIKEIQVSHSDYVGGILACFVFIMSIAFFALLSSPKVHSLMISTILELYSCGVAMLGLFSLANMSYIFVKDIGFKFLSQTLGIIAPSLFLVSILLMSKFEIDILDVYGIKGVHSILLEADPLSAWPREVFNNVKRYCKDKFLVLITRPASVLTSQIKCDIIALTDPSATYPQHLGGGVYRISPEATHILNFIARVKKEYMKPMCLVFDSLTDIIATLGVREGYRIARDMLSLLGPDDVAIFVLFPKAHGESEVALMRTLFVQRLEAV